VSDRELLELAAKAAGVELTDADRAAWLNKSSYGWNPLDDDGDALRLAVKLGLDLELHGCNSTHPYAVAFDCNRNIAEEEQPDNGDPYAATRRAIVRAAAEIGRNMT
jgi:hypothetical protein